ncbi:hypothetical protein pb186bvf_004749 [Paramecium bursaria]
MLPPIKQLNKKTKQTMLIMIIKSDSQVDLEGFERHQDCFEYNIANSNQ